MRRGKSMLLLIGLALLVLGGVRFGVPVLARNRLYARLVFSWERHWPFERGAYLPTRFGPLLKSMGLIESIRLQSERGVNMLLDPTDSIDQAQLLSGNVNASIWALVQEHLPPGGTLVDVGAQKGTISLRAANYVGSAGRVISIEPNPVSAAVLRENIKASGHSNVEVLELACGREPGELDLYIGPRMNTGAASLSKRQAVEAGGSGSSYRVKVLPLDDIVRASGLSAVHVIKVDTEGAETMIIQGAQETLGRFQPTLVLETVDHHLRNMGSSLEELEDLLRRLGYQKSRELPTDTQWVFASSPTNAGVVSPSDDP